MKIVLKIFSKMRLQITFEKTDIPMPLKDDSAIATYEECLACGNVLILCMKFPISIYMYITTDFF